MHESAVAVSRAIFREASGGEVAAAKINLALHVLARRPDGYHLIDSLIVFAELADTVSVVPSPNEKLQLALDGPFAADLEILNQNTKNLVIRAAEALRRTSVNDRSLSGQINLTKRIPIAAGLGGGSADAAGALRLLNRYWALKLSDDQLAKIGLGIGADIPMCLMSKPLVASGIGENLKLANNIPRLPLVLLNPSIPLSTAAVYASLENVERSGLPSLPERFNSLMSFVIWLRQTRNDLSEPAKSKTGHAEEAVEALSSQSDCMLARMSGSGATVFGIFPKLSVAERVADRIRQNRPNWWVTTTETIGS